MDEMEFDNIFLGGVECVVTGWGEHESHIRSALLKIREDDYTKFYKNIKYVYPEDVIISILKDKYHRKTIDTIKEFITFLKRQESKSLDFEDIWSSPKLTSTILTDFINSDDIYDPNELQTINILLLEYAKMLKIKKNLDKLHNITFRKIKPIHISNSVEINKLERDMLPIIKTMEMNMAIIASNCEKLQKNITKNTKRYNGRNENDITMFIE